MNMIILGIHLDQRRSEVCPGIGVNATMFDRYRLISLALTLPGKRRQKSAIAKYTEPAI